VTKLAAGPLAGPGDGTEQSGKAEKREKRKSVKSVKSVNLRGKE